MICQNEAADMQTEKIISLARERGVIRAADVENAGASRTLLSYLAKKGALRRVSRGAYALADYMPVHEDFLAATTAVPHGIICLLSALQFHEITTQMPMETWIAIKRGTRMPTCRVLDLHVVRLTGPAFSEGVEEHDADGIVIRIYSAAKTVVDCFKFRNKIGIDVAREALRDTLQQKKATRDEIWRLAKCSRMAHIMQPYLEMIP
ncbi:MAG: type IV toxin-antitoxin system AbiEi family antitoxin domain-containing protein [Kiritimatiellia bacterium]